MNLYQERLFQRLLEKNAHLSANQARTWVELLWEDFEATYAKAGMEYKGSATTEKVVSRLIECYGDKLHQFALHNPKYKHLLEQNKTTLQ